MSNRKVIKNASWIIGTQIIRIIISVFITMFTARYLGPSNYGLVNYASSIVTFVAPIMYLGLNSILVQEIVNQPENEGELLGSCIAMSLASSVMCILGVISFVALSNKGEQDTLIVCSLYSILLVFQSMDLVNYWFQAKLLSKYSSLVALLSYFVISAYRIFLLATGKSIYWFAVSNSLDYFINAAVLFAIYWKMGGKPLRFRFSTAKRLIGKSKYFILPAMMVSVFSQTDRIMLKLMCGNAAAGYYSAAVTCVGMAGFIYTSIITSFRPAIFEAKKADQRQFENRMRELYSIIVYIPLLQSIVINLAAELIVKILYGAEFAASVPVMRIIAWYTTFSYMGSVRNIWMLAEGHHQYLWIINLSGALVNVVLNLLLIPPMGANGAALASLITQIFTNVIMGFIIKPIRYNNRLLLQSLNPKWICNMILQLRKG